MAKPIYWAFGVILALAAVWVAGRKDDSAPAVSDATQTPTAPRTRSVTPLAADPASTDVPSGTSPASPHEVGNAPPIDITPGFDLLLQKSSEMDETDMRRAMVVRHEQLQSEPRDANWSERVEAELRKGIEDSLLAKNLDTKRVDITVLECRTSGCEIQALGYKEDNIRDGVDLQTIIPRLMLQSPVGQEFENNLLGMMNEHNDGRIAFLYLLPRKNK
jgi:hypothetical protein